MNKFMSAKLDHCQKEFADNSKVYFDSPCEPSSIPPLNPTPFTPALEFVMPGYMEMINYHPIP
jgi:hypothetical protein